MNLSDNLTKLLNAQMNVELSNFLFYSQAANLLEAVSWDGYAKYMRAAASDEVSHSNKFRDYLIDRNAVPRLTGISFVGVNEPASRAVMPISFFQQALSAEQANTVRLNNILDAAKYEEEDDLYLWMAWAMQEQRESERELQDIINRLEDASNDKAALLEIEEIVEELVK